jgi:DNA-binding transcriptional LysR family regulator
MLQHLRTFIVVAEECHFTRAAARLHIAQPAVSQQIRTLEQQVGQQLLERNARSVRLTRAGQVFLPHARAAVHAADKGFAEVASSAGTLRVGLVESAGPTHAPRLLTEFLARYPGIDLHVSQDGSEQMSDQVRAAELDVAFIAFPDARCPAGVTAHWLHPTESLVVAVAADHPLSSQGRLRLSDITDEPLIALRQGTGNRSVIERIYAEHGTRPRIICEAPNLAVAMSFVAENLGLCLAPRSTVATAAPAVTAVELAEPVLQRHLALVWRSPEAAGLLARAFVAFTASEPRWSGR